MEAVTLPTALVPDTPVTDSTLTLAVVTEPTDPVPETPVTLTLRLPQP